MQLHVSNQMSLYIHVHVYTCTCIHVVYVYVGGAAGKPDYTGIHVATALFCEHLLGLAFIYIYVHVCRSGVSVAHSCRSGHWNTHGIFF